MKILIISDVHANSTALESVLAHAYKDGNNSSQFDAVWCLGDLIGYGPDPNECVERIAELENLICLIGNHDQAALGEIPLSRFNQDARLAASWTSDVLSADNEKFLRSLPTEVTTGQFTLVHGSPRAPIWEYILDPDTADRNFEILKTDYCLVGHSHIALSFQMSDGQQNSALRHVQWEQPIELTPRMILNPGSVGQPRDMDPRASYAVLELETPSWEVRRVEYPVQEVQQRILDAGLPERHALRLASGW